MATGPTLGMMVKADREALGISQVTLSKLCNPKIHHTFISRIESESRGMSRMMLEAMADALHITNERRRQWRIAAGFGFRSEDVDPVVWQLQERLVSVNPTEANWIRTMVQQVLDRPLGA